jgi:hypothetical protein
MRLLIFFKRAIISISQTDLSKNHNKAPKLHPRLQMPSLPRLPEGYNSMTPQKNTKQRKETLLNVFQQVLLTLKSAYTATYISITGNLTYLFILHPIPRYLVFLLSLPLSVQLNTPANTQQHNNDENNTKPTTHHRLVLSDSK